MKQAITGPPRSTAAKSAPKDEASEWTTFTATAYTARCSDGCTGITASGVDVRRTVKHEGRTVVAVDPRVIKLGTKLTVKLADGTRIKAIAEDTGGAIKRKKIDVLVASNKEARKFGRQKVAVHIDE
ncbi:3D domain-containing protein [Paenibacillus sp. SN-8-1]|uniref:3D domain-containing protein n=1 Tax=Paenibacillus sp. SN-8-1 TaxID=3435409 RepID=UPI003D9A950F